MNFIQAVEIKFFIFYILFVITTLIFLDKFHLGYFLIGWGCFSLLRFVYLNDTPTKKLPIILNLPSRLLFGLNQEKENYIKKIGQIYSTKIFLSFYFIAIIFLIYKTGLFLSSYSALLSVEEKEIALYAFLGWAVKCALFGLVLLSGISFLELAKNMFQKIIGKNS